MADQEVFRVFNSGYTELYNLAVINASAPTVTNLITDGETYSFRTQEGSIGDYNGDGGTPNSKLILKFDEPTGLTRKILDLGGSIATEIDSLIRADNTGFPIIRMGCRIRIRNIISDFDLTTVTWNNVIISPSLNIGDIVFEKDILDTSDFQIEEAFVPGVKSYRALCSNGASLLCPLHLFMFSRVEQKSYGLIIDLCGTGSSSSGPSSINNGYQFVQARYARSEFNCGLRTIR